jgi:LysM repeat protein
MKSPRLLTLLLIGFIMLTAYPIRAIAESAVYPPSDPVIVDDLFNRLNTLRARRGLHPYQLNPALNAAAQDQAEWLVHTGIRGHRRPDGSTPRARVETAGYQYSGWCCGENYYMSIDATPDMVWNFWVSSSGHYLNLMHRDFQEVGIAMTTDGYRISYVMVFATPFDPAAATPSPATIETAVEPLTEAPEGYHIVQRGETLFRIGLGYGVTAQALAAANGIVNPSIIYPGQRLVIPGISGSPPDAQVTEIIEPPATPPIATNGTYRVQRGETLFRIALRYGVSVEALAVANDIADPRQLRAGQVLVIPVSGDD